MLHQPSAASSAVLRRCGGALKKRGNYNCGRCGLPKKGHVCSSADAGPPFPPPRSDHRLRRALSFEDDRAAEEEDDELAKALALVPSMELPDEEEEEDQWEHGSEVVGGVLPATCLLEVLRRLSPKELMGATAVCRGWRECVRRVWRSAEELRLRVPPRSQFGLVGSVLNKCSGLSRLALRMERCLSQCD